LGELDLEAVLKRRPRLVVVDELAHTNVPGSRHVKRWQDVEELLAAGIDVFTTLNVQHLESRADTVRQITGVAVRETVPDSMIEAADEIQLVDLTPAQLRERLTEGKVYLGDRAAAAADNFFKASNLTALRELALRLTAERVDKQLRELRADRQISGHLAQRRAAPRGGWLQSILHATDPLDSPHGLRPRRPMDRLSTSSPLHRSRRRSESCWRRISPWPAS